MIIFKAENIFKHLHTNLTIVNSIPKSDHDSPRSTICSHAQANAYAYAYTHASMYKHTHALTHTHANTHSNTRTHARTHAKGGSLGPEAIGH